VSWQSGRDCVADAEPVAAPDTAAFFVRGAFRVEVLPVAVPAGPVSRIVRRHPTQAPPGRTSFTGDVFSGQRFCGWRQWVGRQGRPGSIARSADRGRAEYSISGRSCGHPLSAVRALTTGRKPRNTSGRPRRPRGQRRSRAAVTGNRSVREDGIGAAGGRARWQLEARLRRGIMS
jgi:hypothetical protein